jgi:methylenetetrahydrofolate dehydrogenase (NADP+)/methenyltetrahydrofolate cyclohydrolase
MDHILLRFGSKDMNSMMETISKLNNDETCQGYIVQLPLPTEYCSKTVLASISMAKDVDCLHTDNLKIVEKKGEQASILPCTSQAILHICDDYGIDLKGKNAVIIGKSLLVGIPTAMMLTSRGANVKLFDQFSEEDVH